MKHFIYRMDHHHERGQTLVEILVAIALAGILLPALMTAFVASREGRVQEELRVQATALLREAEEAARSARCSVRSRKKLDGLCRQRDLSTEHFRL